MTKEELQAIREIMQEELAPIQIDITEMKSDIAELKESMEEVRNSTNYLAEWVENLEAAFKNHEITGKG